MDRPVMNPTFTSEETPKPKAKPRFVRLTRLLRVLSRLLLWTPFKRRVAFRNEEGSKLGRFVRGLTYRLAFVPVVLVCFVIALVFGATHPGSVADTSDPMASGVYYDPVNFPADDGAAVEGWLVPVLDARRVLEGKDLAVNKRYPAVVLVHDFAASRQQMLPMVQPLHEAGFVVLAINLRGASDGSRQAQTFGIKESLDIKAAVEMLRRRAYVDAAKIGLVGIGTGANAALIATRNDPAIAAVVIAAPVDGFDQALANRIGSDQGWLPALRPMLRWTFQIMNGVDTEELEIANFRNVMDTRHVLMTDGRAGLMHAGSMRGVERFLQKHLTGELASAK
jgi:pimeloyl-ACP methyl ester carboxylesterase